MTGIRKVPEDFRPHTRWGTNLYPAMPGLVDVITLHSENGIVTDTFARGRQGFHVPASTMTPADQKAVYDRHHGK